ncbi:MAG: hypothetical protein ACTSUE_19300 [Promethearchaeota archaeon]
MSNATYNAPMNHGSNIDMIGYQQGTHKQTIAPADGNSGNMHSAFFGDMGQDPKLQGANRESMHTHRTMPNYYVRTGRNAFLEETIEGLFLLDSDWQTTVALPYYEDDNIKFTMNVWYFDKALAAHVPHEGIPRIVKSGYSVKEEVSIRRGIAIVLEHDYMTTPDGRMSYIRGMAQIKTIVQLTNALDVMHTLMNAHDTEKMWQEMHGYKDISVEAAFRKEVEQFGMVQKDIRGFAKLEAEASAHLARQGVQADMIVVPKKLRAFTELAQPIASQYEFYDTPSSFTPLPGPRASGSFRNINVYEAPLHDIFSREQHIDLLNRDVRIGEYNVMRNLYRQMEQGEKYSSRCRNIRIFDEDYGGGGLIREVQFKDALRHSGRFEANGLLSHKHVYFNNRSSRTSEDIFAYDDGYGSLKLCSHFGQMEYHNLNFQDAHVVAQSACQNFTDAQRATIADGKALFDELASRSTFGGLPADNNENGAGYASFWGINQLATRGSPTDSLAVRARKFMSAFNVLYARLRSAFRGTNPLLNPDACPLQFRGNVNVGNSMRPAFNSNEMRGKCTLFENAIARDTVPIFSVQAGNNTPLDTDPREALSALKKNLGKNGKNDYLLISKIFQLLDNFSHERDAEVLKTNFILAMSKLSEDGQEDARATWLYDEAKGLSGMMDALAEVYQDQSRDFRIEDFKPVQDVVNDVIGGDTENVGVNAGAYTPFVATTSFNDANVTPVGTMGSKTGHLEPASANYELVPTPSLSKSKEHMFVNIPGVVFHPANSFESETEMDAAAASRGRQKRLRLTTGDGGVPDPFDDVNGISNVHGTFSEEEMNMTRMALDTWRHGDDQVEYPNQSNPILDGDGHSYFHMSPAMTNNYEAAYREESEVCMLVCRLVFLHATLTRQTMEAMIDANVQLPVNFILWRPWMGYEMSSLIYMKGGRSTGMTVYGHTNFMLSQDGHTKMLFASLTYYSKAIVRKPKNIIVMDNAFYNDYLGGMGIEFYSDFELQELRNKKYLIDTTLRNYPSIISSMIPVTEGNNFMSRMDLRGYFDRGDVAHYSTHEFENEIRGFKSMAAQKLGMLHFRRAFRVNSVCFQGYQEMFTGGNDRSKLWGEYIQNTGHHGTNTYNGCGEVRQAKMKAYRQVSYTKEVMVAST